MVSVTAYPFMIPNRESGVRSERDFLGLKFLETIVFDTPDKEIPHLPFFRDFYDLNALPLNGHKGFTTSFIYSRESKDVDIPGSILITSSKSPFTGYRDSINVELTYAPVSTAPVKVKNLPTLNSQKYTGTHATSGYQYEILVEKRYMDLNGSLLLDPEEEVYNQVHVVSRPGIYALQSTEIAYGNNTLSKSTRHTTNRFLDLLPPNAKKRILHEAGEPTETFITNLSDDKNSGKHYETSLLTGLNDITPIVLTPTPLALGAKKILSGPTVPSFAKKRTTISGIIPESSEAVPVNCYDTVSTQHFFKVEVASPSDLWRLAPGIYLTTFFTLFESGPDPDDASETKTVPILSHQIKKPYMIPGSLRVGGNLIQWILNARAFILDPYVYQKWKAEMHENVCWFWDSHSTTISSFPVEQQWTYSLEHVKFVLRGLIAEIISREANNTSDEFHPFLWFLAGLPVIQTYNVLDFNVIDTISKGPVLTDRRPLLRSFTEHKHISSMTCPMQNVSVEVQGAAIIPTTSLKSLLLAECMASRTKVPSDPNSHPIPLTRFAFGDHNNAGINLHQFGKTSMIVSLIRKGEIDFENILNQGGAIFRVTGFGINKYANVENGLLFRVYYN